MTLVIFLDLFLAFLLFFVIVLTITWGTQLWTGTPFVGTPRKVVDEMIRMAKLEGTETVYDIGAGDGRLLTRAKQLFPKLSATGYENALGIWMIGKLRILFSGTSVRFLCRDALKKNFADADVIFLYLVPSVMKKLKSKFDVELRPGTRVVSHGFQFKDKTPSAESTAQGWMKEKRIFVYRW